MIKEKLKIVGPEKQNDEIRDICTKLWKNNFEDSEEYVRYYFDNRWKKSVTLLYDDKSMLHLNPYNMELFGKKKTIYYIVGVCTDKEERHKGYMDFLLRNVFKKLYSENAPFVYLMPASEKIYMPYGFRGMYEIRSFNVLTEEKKVNRSDNGCELVKFNTLSEVQKNELFEYASLKLDSNFQCFVERDQKYFLEKNREMEACGGSVIVFMKSGQIKGYAMYICEDEPEILEFVVDEEYVEIFVENIFKYSEKNSVKNGADKKIIFDETYFIKEQNNGFAFFISEENVRKLLMARIIDITSFVGMISLKDATEEYHIEIADEFIKENNGRWDIILKDRSLIKRGRYNENVYHRMTIAEFGEMIFSKIRFYLNEMV